MWRLLQPSSCRKNKEKTWATRYEMFISNWPTPVKRFNMTSMTSQKYLVDEACRNVSYSWTPNHVNLLKHQNMHPVAWAFDYRHLIRDFSFVFSRSSLSLRFLIFIKNHFFIKQYCVKPNPIEAITVTLDSKCKKKISMRLSNTFPWFWKDASYCEKRPCDINSLKDKGNFSMPLFKKHESIERKQFWVTN